MPNDARAWLNWPSPTTCPMPSRQAVTRVGAALRAALKRLFDRVARPSRYTELTPHAFPWQAKAQVVGRRRRKPDRASAGARRVDDTARTRCSGAGEAISHYCGD